MRDPRSNRFAGRLIRTSQPSSPTVDTVRLSSRVDNSESPLSSSRLYPAGMLNKYAERSHRLTMLTSLLQRSPRLGSSVTPRSCRSVGGNKGCPAIFPISDSLTSFPASATQPTKQSSMHHVFCSLPWAALEIDLMPRLCYSPPGVHESALPLVLAYVGISSKGLRQFLSLSVGSSQDIESRFLVCRGESDW